MYVNVSAGVKQSSGGIFDKSHTSSETRDNYIKHEAGSVPPTPPPLPPFLRQTSSDQRKQVSFALNTGFPIPKKNEGPRINRVVLCFYFLYLFN